MYKSIILLNSLWNGVYNYDKIFDIASYSILKSQNFTFRYDWFSQVRSHTYIHS